VNEINNNLVYIFLALGILVITLFLVRLLRRRSLSAKEFSQLLYTNVEGVQVAYRQSGSGSHMVLVHGIGASGFVFRNIFSELCLSYKVTAIDLPGFGMSDKDTELMYDLDAQTMRLHKILKNLKIEKAFLIGSSMGGSICLNLALNFPQNYSKVVAIAPATDRGLVSLLGKFAVPTLPLIGFALNFSSMKFMLSRISSKKELITDDVVHEYLKPFQNRMKAIATFKMAIKTIDDSRIPQLYKDINSQVLILWGKGDFIVPEKYMHDLESVIPGSRLQIHPTAGHHPFEDEPDWVITKIKEFC
jgi:pimeloyl-ACP methyl ester carboxylesterase